MNIRKKERIWFVLWSLSSNEIFMFFVFLALQSTDWFSLNLISWGENFSSNVDYKLWFVSLKMYRSKQEDCLQPLPLILFLNRNNPFDRDGCWLTIIKYQFNRKILSGNFILFIFSLICLLLLKSKFTLTWWSKYGSILFYLVTT